MITREQIELWYSYRQKMVLLEREYNDNYGRNYPAIDKDVDELKEKIKQLENEIIC